MSTSLEKELENEILKWLERAERIVSKISPMGNEPEQERFLKNISAYIFDSKYFLEYDDLIRAFEAIVWAWAWIEIGLEIGILRRESSIDLSLEFS
ncbi:MAG: DUF357 domain-containing protein [Methanotrichaceae archaeon]|nr:DUF357 domain-containing protein [Methanotrichaceae archaeon]